MRRTPTVPPRFASSTDPARFDVRPIAGGPAPCPWHDVRARRRRLARRFNIAALLCAALGLGGFAACVVIQLLRWLA